MGIDGGDRDVFKKVNNIEVDELMWIFYYNLHHWHWFGNASNIY